ncbi:FkbM family methyltransferase [Burkholderia ambifaria]|uniref:Methyltransferase FkbM family n=1 Tax=Burkholderia ambifaria MEX-5 TaxID=396597 RepID=B1T468_9BURK|nr:FkbM family methyltransferase [Burkholderia ambifaria]EDT41623.1 methyltransferase FkbM family [Burkholderia ambifaria MEX-5]
MKVAYVLASTNHGPLIVNRNDENHNQEYGTYGVGWNLLETGSFYQSDIELLKAILQIKKKKNAGRRPTVAVDCGANVGVHTIEFARVLDGVGSVVSIEAQRPIYYALCGNIAINNCFNVDARNVAIGDSDGSLRIPFIDYHRKSSFGSLELIPGDGNENIGQSVNYDSGYEIPLISLDSLNLKCIDLVKIDVEGMEDAVICGAVETLKSKRPVMFIEKIKSNFDKMFQALTNLDYYLLDLGPNVLAIASDDTASLEIRELVGHHS